MKFGLHLSGIMLKAIEQGDLEQRLAVMEANVGNRSIDPGSVFSQDPEPEALTG